MSVIKLDLHILSSCAVASRMVLSLEKCGISHCGFNNPEISYKLNGSPLPILTEFLDLGVIRGADTIFNQNPAQTASKAARFAGLIYKAFYSNGSLGCFSLVCFANFVF